MKPQGFVTNCVPNPSCPERSTRLPDRQLCGNIGSPRYVIGGRRIGMSDYEIGRDIQDMRARIERLESSADEGLHGRAQDRSGSGRTVAIDEAGINPEKDAILWKPQQPLRLQPFLYGLFGFVSRLEFDLVPEPRTWT